MYTLNNNVHPFTVGGSVVIVVSSFRSRSHSVFSLITENVPFFIWDRDSKLVKKIEEWFTKRQTRKPIWQVDRITWVGFALPKLLIESHNRVSISSIVKAHSSVAYNKRTKRTSPGRFDSLIQGINLVPLFLCSIHPLTVPCSVFLPSSDKDHGCYCYQGRWSQKCKYGRVTL